MKPSPRIVGTNAPRARRFSGTHFRRMAALSAAAAVSLGPVLSALATELDVVSGQTELTSPTTYGGTTPTSASDITFTANGGSAYSPSAFTVAGTLNAGSLNDLNTLNTGASAISISGVGPINLGGGSNAVAPNATDLIYVASGASLTDTNAPVALAAAGSFDAAGTLSISGVISGAAANGITLNGAGVVTLGGANTYAGNTTLNSGTLNFNNAKAVGAGTLVIAGGTLDNTSGGPITDANNNALSLTGDFTFAGAAGGSHDLNLGTGAVTLSGATRTITVNAGNLTVGGVISGTGFGVTKAGAGTLTLGSAASTYTGPTTISAGTLSVGNVVVASGASGLGNATSAIALGGATTSGTLSYTGAAATMTRPFTVAAGGGEIDSTANTLTLLPASGNVITASGPVTFGGASNVTVGSTTYATTLISGATAVNKVGAGTLTLTTALGTADITNAATPINLQAGALTVTETGTAGPSSGILGSGTITITPGATFTTNAGGGVSVLTLANPIAIAAGSGTATISGQVGAVVDNQAITFASGSTPATILRFSNGNTVTANDTFGGTVSGTGTIQLNSTGASGSPITLSGPQNQTGSISNIGTTAGNTSTSTLSGTLGTSLTGISQAGTNPFTVSSAVPLTATLNSFTSTNTGQFNFTGGFTGAQPLTFNNNSTGLISVSGTAVNNAGSVTNSGTGAGGTTISAVIGTNVTGVTQNSATSPLTLTGVNTYTGATTVSAGTLTLGSGGSLAGTPVTVGGTSNGSLFARGNYTIGTAGSPSLTLTANTGALSLVDGAVNTLSINSATPGATVLTLGGGNTLNFETSTGSTADAVILGNGLAASVTGSNTVNVTALARPAASQTYTLITAPGGGLGSNSNFTLGTVTAGSGVNTAGITYSLVDSGTTLQLLATLAAPSPGVAYFNGQQDNNWNRVTGTSPAATNFTSDAAGATDTQQVPASNTDVFYTSNNAHNFTSSVLNGPFIINSLTLGTGSASGQPVTIAPGTGGSLTINAAASSNTTTYQINGTTNVNFTGNTAGNGILVVPGAGPVTISAPVTLGAAQTWTNNSGSTLTLSGGVTAGANLLTFAGAGNTTISGATAFTTNAGATVSSGAGAVTISAPVTLGGNSTFTNNSTNTLTLGAVTAGANTFATAGSGSITTGAITSTGAVNFAQTGTATVSGNLAGASSAVLTASGGPVTLGGTTNSVKTLAVNTTSVIDVGASGLTLSDGGATTITSTTGGTINATGGGAITLSGSTGNAGDNTVSAGKTLTINAKLTGNTDFEFFPAGGTFVFTNPNNNFNNVIFTNGGGTISVSSFGNAGAPSPLGTGSINFSNGGTVVYTGTGETSSHSINISGTTTGATLDQSGPSGTLNLTAFSTPGAGSKTLTLQGSTAGIGQISAAIVNNAANFTTGVIKQGTGTWVFSGANTYTGTTAVNGGTLTLNNAAVLGATAVTVGNGASGNATLLVRGNNTVGTAAGGSITVNGGTSTTGQGTLSLLDGAVNTLTLANLTTAANSLTLGSASNPAIVNLELGTAVGSNDQIVLGSATSTTNKLNVLAGGTVGGTTGVGAVLNIVPLGGFVSGTYNLLSYPAGQTSTAANGGFAFPNGSQTETLNGATLTLQNTSTAENLVVASNTTAATPTTAYFTGAIDSNWNTINTGGATPATNWATDATGATDTGQVPGTTTDVHFYATGNNTNTANLNTNLGQNFTINSLTLDGNTVSPAATQNVSIAPGASTPTATLTIAPAAATAGITMNSGAGSLTITAALALGAPQTWTNNSSNTLTVSGPSLAGGANALTVTGTGNTTISAPFSGTGLLTKSGTGTLTLGATSSNNGGTTILAGTVASGADNAMSNGPLTLGAVNTTPTVAVNLGTFNQTVASLNVLSNNSTTANTISVGSGKTLTVTGNVSIGYDAGAFTPLAQENTKLTISGAGAVNFSGGALNVGVQQATGNAANLSSGTLDMSGLSGPFTASVTAFNAAGGTGTAGVAGGGNGTAGFITLGTGTNTIITPIMTIGNSNQNNPGGAVGGFNASLTLGRAANVLRADTINVGLSKDVSTISFAAADTTGTVSIANSAGTGAATINLGNSTGTGTSGTATGTLDLRGHFANVNAGVVTLGVNSNTSTGAANGILNFDTGTFAATALNIGSKTGAGTSSNAAGQNAVTIGGGAFTVSGTTAIAVNTGTVSGNVLGSLNINGGTFSTNSLAGANKSQAGTGSATSTIAVAGGSLIVNSGGSFVLATQATAGTAVGNLNITGGSVTSNVDITNGAGAATSTLTLNGGTLDLTGHNLGGTATAALTTINLQSGTLQNVAQINGGAAVTKTGTGTLTIAGTNTYSSSTAVNAGLLLVNGTHSGAGNYSIASNATLGGTGSITLAAAATNGVAVASGGNFAPGNNTVAAGTPLTITAASGTATAVSMADGSNLDILLSHARASNISPGVVDGLNVPTGVVALGTSTGPNLVLTQDGTVQQGDTFTIIDPTSITGPLTFANGNTGTSNGIGYTVNFNTASTPQTVTLTVTAVPEPASVGLLGLGAVGLLARGRRRAAARA